MMSKVKSVLKHKANEMETLLRTTDSKEQIERIKVLMRPVFTLAVTFDARTGQVSLTNIGPEIPAQVAHQMLDGARQVLVQMQTQPQDKEQPAPPAENNEG